jgi:hypothetical protein
MTKRFVAMLAVLVFAIVSGWTIAGASGPGATRHHAAQLHQLAPGESLAATVTCEAAKECGAMSPATCAIVCVGLLHFASPERDGLAAVYTAAEYDSRAGPALSPVLPGADERPPKIGFL